MSTSTILELCLTHPYPVVLEKCGISYTTYLAARREHRYPPRNNNARRNMTFRQQVFDIVRRHPEYSYRDVAEKLLVPLPRVWKVFTDYMFHDDDVRYRIAQRNVRLM